MWELVSGDSSPPKWTRRYFVMNDRVLGSWDSDKEYRGGRSSKRPVSVLGSACKMIGKSRTCDQGDCPCALSPKDTCPECLHSAEQHSTTKKQDEGKFVFSVALPKSKPANYRQQQPQRIPQTPQACLYFAVATQRELNEWVGAIDWSKDQDMMVANNAERKTRETDEESMEELERQRKVLETEFSAALTNVDTNSNLLLNREMAKVQAQKIYAKLQNIEERITSRMQSRVVRVALTDAQVEKFAQDIIEKKIVSATKLQVDISFTTQLTNEGLSNLCSKLASPQLRILRFSVRCTPQTQNYGASCMARNISDNSTFAALTHLDLNACNIT